jgi:CBS domain-containing protein
MLSFFRKRMREEIMSRYRDDDDRDYYGERGGGGRGLSDDRYGSERTDYGRGPYDRGYGYDESSGARRSSSSRAAGGERGDYGGEDYGRGGYGERADYRYGERRSRDYYGEGGAYWRDYDREGDGRSIYDEGRGYRRERAAGAGRGASRSHVRCRDIMTRDVTVATRDTTLEKVAAMMRDEDTGVIPVVEPQDASLTTGETANEGRRRGGNGRQSQGKLVGLITDRDIVVRALAEGKDALTTLAEEVMTTDIHTARPNDRVIDAIRKMGDKQVRRIPVVSENGELRGIISMADVALETEEDRELADALEEISSGSSFWSKIFG